MTDLFTLQSENRRIGTEGNCRKSVMKTDNTKIVIIGCGISGISAAHRLVKSGFRHVRILEATGRSGGRIKTGRFGK